MLGVAQIYTLKQGIAVYSAPTVTFIASQSNQKRRINTYEVLMIESPNATRATWFPNQKYVAAMINHVFGLGLIAVFLLGCAPQIQEVEEVYMVAENGEVLMITVIPPTVEWTSSPEPIPDGPSLAVPLDPLLANTSWHLVELEGEPFPTDLAATMDFTENGVEGVILCNKWQSIGALTAANGRFSFPYIATTSVGCGNIDIHKRFGEALTIHAKTYTLENSALAIKNEQEETILLFKQVEITNNHYEIRHHLANQPQPPAWHQLRPG